MNTLAATQLVAAREVRAKLRDRTFLLSTLIFLLIAAAATTLPSLLSDGPATVAATPEVSAELRAAGLEVREVPDDAAAERAVRDGDTDAAVVAGPTVLARDEAPADVVAALSVEPPVRLLNPAPAEPPGAVLVPFVFAFVFLLTSQTFGVQIAQSIIEEKQTRIVEILVAAVSVRALLAGKMIAGTVLALGQIALVALVAVVGLRLFGDSELLNLLGPAIGWFLPYFLLGFVLIAALWAAAGALVSRLEDIGTVAMPVQLVVMLPFFGVIFLSDNAFAMQVLSYVPFSAPTAMPLRLFTGDAAGWEPPLSLALLLITALAVLAAGARVYEGSLLRTNGNTSLRTAWRERETVD